MGGIIHSMLTASVVDHEFKPCRVKLKTRILAFAASLLSTVFSIQSCRSCYATLHLCQCPFYKNLVKLALTEMLCSVAGTTTLDRE